LYHGKLGDLAPDNKVWNLIELVGLYLFGVNKCSNALKNTVMGEIQDYPDLGLEFFELSGVKTIYDSTVSTEDAPIRKFSCAFIRWVQYNEGTDYWGEDELVDFFKECPGALKDYFKLQTELWGQEEHTEGPCQRDATKLFNMCYFHVHADGEQYKATSCYY
jgi:hypothetical protein